MNNSLTTAKLLLLPTFLAIAGLRIFADNSRMVNYLNIAALAFAIDVLIETIQIPHKAEEKIYHLLVIAQFVVALLGIGFFLYEFQCHFMSDALSDGISIIALGISLPNATLANLINFFLIKPDTKDKGN